MQMKHVFSMAVAVLVSVLSSTGTAPAQTRDSVILGIAEATYQAGANEAPSAAIEEAKKLALRSFTERTLGGYVIRRAQVQNTHLMQSYLDFWSGAHVRVDSVLASRYWTEAQGNAVVYRAYFSAQVRIPSSEIQHFKSVIADIEQEVATKLREELLAAERASRQKDAAPSSAVELSELRAELERHAIVARIEAEKLRLERIDAEEKRRHQEEQARQAREEQLVRARQVAAERLAALRDSVAAMRGPAQIPASLLGSPLATLREMRRIDAQIKEIKAQYHGELQHAILMVSQSMNPQFQAAVSARKSEFETDVEFRTRTGKMRQDAEQEQTARVAETSARIASAYQEESAPFIAVLKQLSGQRLTLVWQDLKLELGTYNPQFNAYPVSIRIKEPMDGLVVLASAQIPMSREEAQVFKQHAEHDILRPELVGNFQTTQFFRVAAAYVIDDATNKQYDLFSSKFVDLGNSIIYDSATRLLWLKDADWFKGVMTWADAKEACSNLEIVGLSGWRLPTDRELIRMYTVAHNQEPHPFGEIKSAWYGSSPPGYWTGVPGNDVGPAGTAIMVNFVYRISYPDLSDWRFSGKVWPVKNGQ